MKSIAGKELHLEVDGKSYLVLIESLSTEKATVVINGRRHEVLVRGLASGPSTPPIATPEPSSPVAESRPHPSPAGAVHGPGTLVAPMPGVVLRVLATPGQEVHPETVVAVLEAMKMENAICAGRHGRITAVHVEVGQQVATGEPLLSFTQGS